MCLLVVRLPGARAGPRQRQPASIQRIGFWPGRFNRSACGEFRIALADPGSVDRQLVAEQDQPDPGRIEAPEGRQSKFRFHSNQRIRIKKSDVFVRRPAHTGNRLRVQHRHEMDALFCVPPGWCHGTLCRRSQSGIDVCRRGKHRLTGLGTQRNRARGALGPRLAHGVRRGVGSFSCERRHRHTAAGRLQHRGRQHPGSDGRRRAVAAIPRL